MRTRKKWLESTSAAAPDMDWQNLQIDQYGNVVNSYNDYVDHYSGSERHSGDPLLDAAMLAMDELVMLIESRRGSAREQLAVARDVIFMFQEMRMIVEDARESIKDVRKLKSDLYGSIDRENVLSTQKRELEEKLNIVKNSDIRSMRRLVNVVKQGSNNDKVESVENRGPKITFDPKPGKWPGDGPIETWTPPF